jgi:hypothetical protein
MTSNYGINPLTINPDLERGRLKLQAIAVATNLRRSLRLGVDRVGLSILILEQLYRNFGITQ